MTTLAAEKERLWQELHEDLSRRRIRPTHPDAVELYASYVRAVTALEKQDAAKGGR